MRFWFYQVRTRLIGRAGDRGANPGWVAMTAVLEFPPVRVVAPWILTVFLVGTFLAVPAVAGDVEDESAEMDEPQDEELDPDDEIDSDRPYDEFDDLVYAKDWPSAVTASKERLDSLLEERVESVGWITDLTESQRERLLLAGRGDIKRLLQRAEEWKRERGRVRYAGDPFVPLQEILQKARPLRAEFTAGPFDEKSYLARIARRTLTSEQWEDQAALCAIEEAGGRRAAHGTGPDQMK